MPSISASRASQMTVLALALVMLVPAPALGTGEPVEEARGSRIYVEPGLEYVAVAPGQLARHLAPLIEWKMDRGVPAQIFNTETILGTYQGRDDAERLHNFLQDLYFNETDGSPRWLLLGGDSDQVPVRQLWANRDHSGRTTHDRNLYAGDTYYSGLGSDWDLDGDGVFGEPGEEDLTPELYVGRFPASLPEEMEAAVTKTLAYELDPPGGDWYRNVFLAGALMDEPNLLDNPFTLPRDSSSYTDEGFDPHSDNAYEATQKVRAVLGEDWDFVELADYPFFEGCLYTAQNDTLHRLASASTWDRGNAFVFWAAHGYEAFGGLAEYEGTGTSGMFESARPFITYEDTQSPVTGGMLPLVYISSCYAGQFHEGDTTSFESMLTVPEGGAIALISGDGDTFRLENISVRSFGNWWLAERFWQLVVDEGRVRPGEALYLLKHQYHQYYLTQGPPPEDSINMDYFYANLYAYNLMGDPEVPVWVGPPGRLALELVRGGVVHAPAIEVRVTDRRTGDPVEGASVFVRGGGLATPLRAETGPDGMAVIGGGPTQLGDRLRLVATLPNWVPNRTLVEVTEGGRDLVLADEGVTGPSTAEFLGQMLAFKAAVTNEGDFSAISVIVRFDSGDPRAPDEDGVEGRYQEQVVTLAPGEGIVVPFHHLYSRPGQYQLTFQVDPDDRYAEDNELNNRVDRQLLLRPLPSLPDSVGPIEVRAGEVHDWPVDLDFYVELPNGFPRKVVFQLGEVTQGVYAWVDQGNNLHIRTDRGSRGTATVTVVMYTEGYETDTMTVLLNITSSNAPPTLEPVADRTVEAGEELVVRLNASDIDGDDLVFTTSLEGAVIAAGTLRWTSARSDAGVRFPTVTVTDEHGESATVRLRVEVVTVNSAPTLMGFDDRLEVEVDEVASLLVTALDADGDRLTYRLASADEGFSIDPATGLVTYDATGVAPGTYSSLVVVTDGEASVERTLTVEVLGTSPVPTFVLLVAGILLVAAVAASYLFRR